MIFAAAFNASDPTTWIGAGGVAGAVMFVIFIFVKGWVVPGYIYTAEVEASKKKDERAQQVVDAWQNTIIPALMNSTQAHDKTLETLPKVLELVTRLNAELDAARPARKTGR